MARPETLVEHLMWQVRLSNFSALEEELAEYMIRSVGGGGYLRGLSAAQIAHRTGNSTLRVEQVLRKIQSLDPLALGSRNLAEALWIQATYPDDPIEDPLVLAIITKHLGALETKKYQSIVRDTGEPLEEVYEAIKVIMALEPRPARSFAVEDPHYITPDVYVAKIGDEWVVTLNDDGLPKLKISNFYKAAIGSAGEAKDYITEASALGPVADPLDPAAAAHNHEGHQEHPEVSKGVLREGPAVSTPSHPQGRGGGHRDARVHRESRDDQQVRAHAAGDLRAQVLLQRRYQPSQR